MLSSMWVGLVSCLASPFVTKKNPWSQVFLSEGEQQLITEVYHMLVRSDERFLPYKIQT